MRVFLAVFPPPAVQSAAAVVIDGLRAPGDGVSWVRRENLHYTLSFLGELGDDGLRRANEAALEAACDHAAFTARLGDCGAFPNAARARVLWIGLHEGADALVALARSVERALVRRGFDRDERPFAPHLTIGRVRQPRADWSEPLARTHVDASQAEFTVAGVRVIESTLSPGGSRYEVREDAALRAAAEA